MMGMKLASAMVLIMAASLALPCQAQSKYSGRISRYAGQADSSGYQQQTGNSAPLDGAGTQAPASAAGATQAPIVINNYMVGGSQLPGGVATWNPWDNSPPQDLDPSFHAPVVQQDDWLQRTLAQGDVQDSSTSLQSTLGMQNAAALFSLQAGQQAQTGYNYGGGGFYAMPYMGTYGSGAYGSGAYGSGAYGSGAYGSGAYGAGGYGMNSTMAPMGGMSRGMAPVNGGGPSISVSPARSSAPATSTAGSGACCVRRCR